MKVALLSLPVALFLLAAPAFAGLVPPGFDLFETLPGTLVEIGTEPGGDNPPIPPGLFGIKNGMLSDPLIQIVPLNGLAIVHNRVPTKRHRITYPVDAHGNDVGPNSIHKVKDVAFTDTIVERLDSYLLENVGDSAIVRIRMDALSLVSADPIQVTYGAEPPSFFDLFIDLNPNVPQMIGRMKLTATEVTQPDAETNIVKGNVSLGTKGLPCDDPAVFAADPTCLGLPVTYRLRFVERGNDPGVPDEVVLTQDATGKNLLSIFHITTGEFERIQIIPEPASALLMVGGLAVLFLAGRQFQIRNR
jgi:hypothetical protein